MIGLFSKNSARLVLPLVLSVWAVGFGSVSKMALAQENSGGEPTVAKKPEVEMLECKVKVVDPDGYPVEGASVFCTGLRSKENRSSHWGWADDEFGDLPRRKTDAEGIVVMPYPKMLSEEESTGEMTWSVEYPDFVNYRRDHSVDDDPAEVVLERGFRIALTAKDAVTGMPLKKNLFAVTSFEQGAEWKQQKNGTLVSGVFKKQDGIVRVACFQDGRPTLFSDEIKVSPGDKSRLLMKDVELSVGCRMEGKLDDSVTRPVSNGYVIAVIAKKPDSKKWNRLSWRDEAAIGADGTFVFESLPKAEVIQLIPICDGFVPAKPKLEDVLAAFPGRDPDNVKGKINSFFVTPQLVESQGKKVTASLAMNKASSVTVTVVDEDGKPVEDLKVGTNPNQYWFNSGSNILGSSYPTRKFWEWKRDGKDVRAYYKSKRSSYVKQTDENGVAYFQNLPKGFTHDFGVYEKEWEIPIDQESGRREKRVKVLDEEHKITIVVYPKGALPRDEKPVE